MIKKFTLNYYCGWSVSIISLEDQVLLFLMKLRHNFSHLDLAFRFQVSQATITNVFQTLLYCIHKILYLPCMKTVPSLKKVQSSKSECFKNFPNCREIWDCTDVFIDRPRSDLNAQKSTYSHYRGGNTLKALIAIAPNGAIIYCSYLYTGCTSDQSIVAKCGILTHLQSGDLILADKGFLISKLLPSGVYCNIPPFVPSDSRQFTENQIKMSQTISKSRIHVERAIQRIKSYSILDKLPYQYVEQATIIFQVCCLLVNMQNPIIKI